MKMTNDGRGGDHESKKLTSDSSGKEEPESPHRYNSKNLFLSSFENKPFLSKINKKFVIYLFL